MADTATVNWYGDRVTLKVKGAKQKILDELALVGEGKAKMNIVANNQVDTGFMLNSVYAVTSKGVASKPSGGGTFTNRLGQTVTRRAGPVHGKVAEGESAIAAAAEYAIHQEMKKSFLYRALEQIASEAGGIIERIGAEELSE